MIFLLPSQARKCKTGLAVWEISESRLGIPDQPRKEFSVSTAGGSYSRVNDDRLLMKKSVWLKRKGESECAKISLVWQQPSGSWPFCVKVSQATRNQLDYTLWSTNHEHTSVCFLDKWLQTKCKVTFDTCAWSSFSCSFMWYLQIYSPW